MVRKTTNTENKRRALSRRAIIKGSATIATVGAVAGTPATATDDELSELAEAEVEDVEDFFRSQYDTEEAQVVAHGWDYYRERVLDGDLTKAKAHEGLREYLRSNTTAIANDIEDHLEFRENGRQTTANPEAMPEEEFVTMTGDEEELTLAVTDEGASGVGFTETRALGPYWLEAHASSAGYGDATAWVESWAGFHSEEAANYEISTDYYRRGATTSADAEILLFVERIGGNRRTEIIDTGGTRGDTSATKDWFLETGGNYRIGFYLECSLLGLGASMISDYYSGYFNGRLQPETIEIRKMT